MMTHRRRRRPPQFPPFLLGALYGFWDGSIRFVRASPRNDRAVGAAGAGVVSSSQDAVGRFFRLDENGGGGLEGYEPVSSRGGLVVVRRARESGDSRRPLSRSRKAPSDLCVCDPVAGRRFFLSRPRIHDESHVLLFTGGGGARGRPRPQMIIHVVNLDLLRDKILQIQTFSPETNAWGPVVATSAPLPPSTFLRPAPVVLGAAAYWLCSSRDLGIYVLALHFDGSSRPPALIKLPPLSQIGIVAHPRKELLLVASPDGRLGLAVARRHKITIWTLSSSSSSSSGWTRHAVVDLTSAMAESAPEQELPPLTTDEKVRLQCFAESSGKRLFRLYHGSLFELSLVTMEVRFIGHYSKRKSSSMCAYDMDPASLN